MLVKLFAVPHPIIHYGVTASRAAFEITSEPRAAPSNSASISKEALQVSFPSAILIHLTFAVLWEAFWFRSEFLYRMSCCLFSLFNSLATRGNAFSPLARLVNGEGM